MFGGFGVVGPTRFLPFLSDVCRFFHPANIHKERIMARAFTVTMALALMVMGAVQAQQPVVREVRPQTARSYRSYSVAPTPRGDVRRGAARGSDATWRHADSKATGHFHGGK